MEDPTGISINATRDQIEEFKNSVLWADINKELDFWIEGFATEQDSIVEDAAKNHSSTAEVLLHIGDINGRKKAVAYLKQMLDVFLDVIDSNKKEQEQETNQTMED